ncbi:MAG TPA: DNA polymerase III subunit alpha [Alphaproteobacteria bacterium]|jgi:DNA polymerase-3 subunit alpha
MSKYADFVHLRVHTAYSLLEGALKNYKLAELCKKYAMPAVAMTDSRNLFGAYEFSMALADVGVQPIVGCELAIKRDDGAALPNGAPVGRTPDPDKMVVLCQSAAGYANLTKLISRAYLEGVPGEAAQITHAELCAMSEGLIALTGAADSSIGRLLLTGQDDAALARLDLLQEAFGDRLYIEIQRHNMADELRLEAKVLDLAYARNIPLVATNNVFFSDEGMYEAHDALLAIADGAQVVETDRRRLTPDHRFKSPAEMRALFADLPEAIDNTLVVAQRCAFMATNQKPVLPAFPSGDGRTEAEELHAQAAEGLERRLDVHVFTPEMDEETRNHAARPYRERLAFELSVIEKMGFPGYFLIVSDFIKWAKAHDIPVGPGRGSGAGSVVAWALTITDLNPLQFNLLFERFLNPERISMPDFDIDFCQDRRDEVIRYVQEKYGRDRVAQIITFGKLQARAVLRDVGRVLGMPYGQVDRICKLVPNNPAKPVTLPQAIDGEPALQQMRDEDPSVAKLIALAIKLEGLYRHASTHAAGVVIGNKPLEEIVPLYRDPRSDIPATQFSMKYVEQASLVKFDFLGLKTLTVLQKAVELIHARGDKIDLQTLPLEDKKTFDMLAKADVTGVFQLESSGMRDVLRKLKPDRFEDIIAIVALYRPGPMDNIPKYIACKHGKEQPDYLYPSLEWILKETFGVIIYQEQVMQIAQELSGYSLGGADLLRRAMGKKDAAIMAQQRQEFTKGAVARGVAEKQAGQIYDQVDKFAGYGFNKSHAAAYALVSYQTAYLKANYPLEFLAASMTLDLGNTDKLNTFRQELSRIGVKLLPPDINKSQPVFAVEEQADGTRAIRYALGAVRNVGLAAMQSVVDERVANGPFKDLFDFAGRCDPKAVNKRQLESLAAAGAFDSLHRNRAQAHAGTEAMVAHAQASANERTSSQTNLFGGDPTLAPTAKALPPVTDWPAMERLRHEFDAIGFYLSAHPLDAYAKSLQRLKVISSAQIASQLVGAEQARVKLAGTVIGKKERTSARGNRFAFVQLSDATGMYEITLFSEVLAQARELLEAGKAVMVSADAKRDGEGVRLLANRIQLLEEVAASAAPTLQVHLIEESALAAVKKVIAGIPKGRGHVTLKLDLGPDHTVELEIPGGFAITPAATGVLMTLPGIANVLEN